MIFKKHDVFLTVSLHSVRHCGVLITYVSSKRTNAVHQKKKKEKPKTSSYVTQQFHNRDFQIHYYSKEVRIVFYLFHSDNDTPAAIHQGILTKLFPGA